MSASSLITGRRLVAAVLAAGAAIGVAALPAPAADHDRSARPKVEISAVQYDSPGRDDRSRRSLNKEWVELTNTTRRTVNLDGWTLEEDEDGHTYTFDHYRLAGRATVRIHTGQGRDTRTDLFQDRRNYVWDNRSDTATLRNDRGRFIDNESWGHNRHHGDNRH
ncbi:lamin tail domain-containing protein [Streptomyces scabiei]|nr:lamin tail domain-containing protein [Streptomyces scabiei]